jgi:Raf kinase inhibitor-like YbhB/YbcL family protein
MKLTSDSFEDGGVLPDRLAFCKPDPDSHVTLSDNLSPHLAWSDLPEGTRSLAIVCCDPDVPSKGDDVNQADREVPADLPRVDFYHWAMIELSPDRTGLAQGEVSRGVTAGGKAGPEGAFGTRTGVNSYREWFAGGDDESMKGDYHGYDGPCPPFNDSLIHHYHFTVYALDVDKVGVDGVFDCASVVDAVEGHVLASASIMGTFALNPRLR